jgi:glycosyltransferase involved in cell wall biosynthesis
MHDDRAERHILVLPPHNLWPAWTGAPNLAEPDREEIWRLLEPRGYSRARLDPFGLPWNPFARSHPALLAIDPARALCVLLFHRHADIVVCNFESSALLILLLRRLFRFRGKVVVYDIGVAGAWRLRDRILRLVVPRADLLLPLGRAQVPGLLALGVRPERVHPVHQGVSTDFYTDARDAPDGYVLAVGDDVSRDYPTLLTASAGLTQEVRIRSRVIRENRQDHPAVTVVSGRLTPDEYRALIAGAVLVVLPLYKSVHAGGISTLLEAMSSGKPVIVSASPGLADYVEDGVTCRVVPPGDPAALRQAIDALLGDVAERRRLGANARRFTVESCSRAANAAQLAEVFARLDRMPVD